MNTTEMFKSHFKCLLTLTAVSEEFYIHAPKNREALCVMLSCAYHTHYWEVSLCRTFGVPKRDFRNATAKMDGLFT